MKKITFLFIVWMAVSSVAFGQTDLPVFKDFITRLQSVQKQYLQNYEEKRF